MIGGSRLTGYKCGMAALPFVVKALVVLLLVASIARGFLGAPARQPHPRAARALLLTAVCAALSGIVAFLLAAELVAAISAVIAVEAASLSAWCARAAGGGGDDGGGDDEPEPEPAGPPAIDWAAFDRARRSWERTPVG
jgi:hypothetical protein